MQPFDFRLRGTPELLEWLEKEGQTRSASIGTQLIEEGGYAKSLLFLLEGEVSAKTTNKNNLDIQLNTLLPGAVMGEMSWLEGRPAVADIVARSTIKLLEVPFSSIKTVALSDPRLAAQLHRLTAQKLALQIQDQNVSLSSETTGLTEPLRKVLTLFAHLHERDVHKLAVFGQLQRLAPGSVLLRQGEPVLALHLILNGDGVIQINLDGAVHPVGRVQRGELIGEMTLLLEEQAGASAAVLAKDGLDLLTIDRDRLVMELSADPPLSCRFYKALACMLSQRSRDQLQRHQLGQLSRRIELDAGDSENDQDVLDLKELKDVSRGARQFDWLCNHFQNTRTGSRQAS